MFAEKAKKQKSILSICGPWDRVGTLSKSLVKMRISKVVLGVKIKVCSEKRV